MSDIKLQEDVIPQISDRDFTIATIAAPTVMPVEEDKPETEGGEGEGEEGEESVEAKEGEEGKPEDSKEEKKETEVKKEEEPKK